MHLSYVSKTNRHSLIACGGLLGLQDKPTMANGTIRWLANSNPHPSISSWRFAPLEWCYI